MSVGFDHCVFGDAIRRLLGGDAAIRIVSSSEGRLVAEVRNGSERFIAKSASDLEARTVFSQLAGLHKSSIGALYVRVPRPITWDSATGIVIMEAFPGSPLSDLHDPSPHVRRVGRALAEIHSFHLMSEPLTLCTHLAELMHPTPDALANALPEYAETIREAQELLRAHTFSRPNVLLHRDFHLRQLFDNDGPIGVVDWDLMACGDPLFDVGYMDSYLASHFGEAGNALRAAFISGYRETGCDFHDEELIVYRCFNLLRRAARRFRLRDTGWQSELSYSLRELQDLLPAAQVKRAQPRKRGCE